MFRRGADSVISAGRIKADFSEEPRRLGIDVGSTTAKIALLNLSDEIVASDYVRHNTRVRETLTEILEALKNSLGDIEVLPAFSGSAAMGLAEMTGSLFVQEIIAASCFIDRSYPDVKSLIDIGGEDAKLVLYSEERPPDIRMNGNCAGGTGAYIDQMAALLGISINEMDRAAWSAEKSFPIASRCGVFAKTDVQNLVSRKIDTPDIAASIFDAVASQIINSVARGCTIEPSILFSGGPLTYISYLRESFSKQLKVSSSDIVVPENSELITAYGAALSQNGESEPVRLSRFIDQLKGVGHSGEGDSTLQPLFGGRESYDRWKADRHIIEMPAAVPQQDEDSFLGIDVGSTTTKIVVINSSEEILFDYYSNNNGRPLETVVNGLSIFAGRLEEAGIRLNIVRSAVTGYGEQLVKSGLSLDHGIVETVAHFLSAKKVEPELSFILDIGGQDIKAIFVQSGVISNIEINEACSSGCGSFIEGFAATLGYPAERFGDIAVDSSGPCDLGTRCTVFMNSKVKQALRDGATVSDISAGLAYSVVQNCLNKVLRIKRTSDIGDTIVVQGGLFKNSAVFRSLELLSGKKIVSTDKPELMGAYGAALYALERYGSGAGAGSFIGLDSLGGATEYRASQTVCGGCSNRCRITTYRFTYGGVCYSGNKCEKIFSNSGDELPAGDNIFDFKQELLFGRIRERGKAGVMRIGMPRVLNMFDNYPFWHTLFTECGIEPVLSGESTNALYKSGTGDIMSDNICFPAKLVHGHILDLCEKGVDRIFYPFVVYEKQEFKSSSNSYNCPVVTAYSEVIRSTTGMAEAAHIPYDMPTFNFDDELLLRKACRHYLKGFGVDERLFSTAFAKAVDEHYRFKMQLKQKNVDIIGDAVESGSPLVLIASHPYHTDQLVHQKISQMLAGMGVHIINEDIVFGEQEENFDLFLTIPQWGYPNRMLQAAAWAVKQGLVGGLIQLNSFGCGPDSFIMDEINELAKRSGLPFALIRIDEIASPGSARLRLRSLVESMRIREQAGAREQHAGQLAAKPLLFGKQDAGRRILAPWFGEFYSPFIPPLAKYFGYNFENLPPPDELSVRYGLEYCNNEVCYPATLVVGDIIRALRSGDYNHDEIAFAVTQTGGQCRATNYITLIKRALFNAGYADIPVVAMAPAKSVYNSQPGFRPNWYKVLKPAFACMLYADSLSRLYYAVACRELVPGTSMRLRQNYLDRGAALTASRKTAQLLPLLREAIAEFNSVEVTGREPIAVGVVGEIYIKYNSFAQFGVSEWLVGQGVEVLLPPLMEFFTQAFVNSSARVKGYIDRKSPSDIFMVLLKKMADIYSIGYEKALREFRYHREGHSIDHSASLAAEILDLNNQYGEGWLIPAEIASLSQGGIDRIVCMQPFGCIANHVVGKGVEMKIKQLYPSANILYLDFDSGVSKVNIINRLHFLLQNSGVESG